MKRRWVLAAQMPDDLGREFYLFEQPNGSWGFRVGKVHVATEDEIRQIATDMQMHDDLYIVPEADAYPFSEENLEEIVKSQVFGDDSHLVKTH